jgi:hypothetical protein
MFEVPILALDDTHHATTNVVPLELPFEHDGASIVPSHAFKDE